MKKYKFLFINNLTLKIIALFFMSLSHIGLFLELNSSYETISFIFKALGSISFPLIVFLEIETFNHTKLTKFYMIRLLVSLIFIYISILTLSFIPYFSSFNIYKFGNIFTDLILFLLIHLIVKSKNKLNYVYFVFIFSFFIFSYLVKMNFISINLYFYKVIGGIFPQYSLFGLILFLLIYFLYYLFDKKVNSIESFIGYNKYYFYKNIIFILVLTLFSIIFYLLSYIGDYLGVDSVIESYIVLGSIFIVFYNYKIGIKNNIIKYSFYIYYPLHLLLLFIIFKALNMI